MKAESYNAKITSDGTNKRERSKNKLIHDLNQHVKDTLIYNSVLINGVAANLSVASGTMANKKNISSECGKTFNIGDIVKYCNSNWLVMTADVNNEIYVRGSMQECNYKLKFQNYDREIVEYDCVIESASQYNSGEEAFKTITIGYNQNLIYIPLNDDTVALKSDDRFFVDNNKIEPKVYRATRVDTVTNVYNGIGYVTVLVTEDQYNPEYDDIDKWICDYKEPIEEPEDIPITFRGNAEVVCGGSYKTFTADRDVTWELVCTSAQEGSITTSISDDKIKIKCSNNLGLIGTIFNLKCKDADDNTGQLYIKIISSV